VNGQEKLLKLSLRMWCARVWARFHWAWLFVWRVSVDIMVISWPGERKSVSEGRLYAVVLRAICFSVLLCVLFLLITCD
jgi:hypothetical protein